MKNSRGKFSDETYLEGILTHDGSVLRSIFHEFLPGIQRHILSNNGTLEEGEDVFMDALEVIYRKVKDGKLELISSFYTYLFEICKRLWLKKLRRKKFHSKVTIDDWKVLKLGEEPKELIEQTERFKLYREKLNLLRDDCQKILRLALIEKKSMKEIAAIMDYSGESYARKRKFQCKEKLLELIRKDARFKELKF